MNIKKESVHQLARAAAGRTGLSQTSVIEESLRMYLAHLDQPAEEGDRRARAMQILEYFATHLDDDDRARLLNHGDLYDEAGLPA